MTTEMPTPAPALSDPAALDAICAVLNTTDSGADAVQAVTEIVTATGRPCIDDLPVVECRVEYDRHALPAAVIDVDGVETVRLWITPDRAIRVRITRPAAAAPSLTVEDDGAPAMDRAR